MRAGGMLAFFARCAPALAAAVVAPWLMVPSVAHAADCANAATQMAMNACAAGDPRAADARLNATFNEVAGRLRGQDDAGHRLVAAERAWVRFRDAECAFDTNQVSGGSIAPMVLAECQTTMTKAREQRLRAYLDCREGDLACPLPPK